MAADAARRTIASLLLSGTPRTICERYLSMPERAEQTTFGLLEKDIVVLDTETTGLSWRKNKLIEIAAARIDGREVVDRFQTFVHPGCPIPPEIVSLTGIRDIDVMDAPSDREAVAALAEFVGGQPVVAHNATFDRSFIQAMPGGDEVTDVWIDSLVLSRIALPRLSTHRLADMAQAFGCECVTHRAADDVDALCGMWRVFLLGLSDLPGGLLQRLADMHPEVDWPIRPLFAHLAQDAYGATFSLRDVRRALVAQGDTHRRTDFDDLDGCVRVPSADQVDDAFGDEGVVAGLYDAYEHRPEQVSMAQEVRASLDEGSHRAIEAGTGVGKSMAYLVPQIMFAHQNDVTVGVATKTNALTDQLVAQELPALDAALPGGVSYCSIKGYDHYPCLHRVDLAMVRELPDPPSSWSDGADEARADMLSAYAVIAAYASQSPEGDLDALGIRWQLLPRDSVTTTPSECLRTRCPYFPHECFVHGARRRAACSDVVVTNHAMLLRDIDLDNAILPPIRHWVVDEAHSFEQEARRQWAKELSKDAATNVFTQVGGVRHGIIHNVLVQSATLDCATLAAGLLTKAATSTHRGSVASEGFFDAVHELIALGRTQGGYDNVTLWIDDQVRQSEVWDSVTTLGAQLLTCLEECAKQLRSASAALAPEAPQLAAEVTEPATKLDELAQAMRVIVLAPDDAYVCSAELYGAKRRRNLERLVAQKFDIGADLSARWYPQTSSVVYTSATIAVGQSFEHFDRSVGFDRLDGVEHKDVQLQSSFDYDTQMSVIVARDMPAPGSDRYLEALEDLLYDTHVHMAGSVLTLFTNRREMDRVYQRLAPRLSTHGLKLLCQEPRSSARRLREQFMADESVSLFALKSFWEGFDAAGDTLRCVVIPKLPFASPNDPLVRERDAREARSWWRYSLPEAVLTVKQAAGRLIRTSTDSGILVLADSRIQTKRYGKTFLQALPSHNCITLESANVGRYIDMWRRSHVKRATR